MLHSGIAVFIDEFGSLGLALLLRKRMRHILVVISITRKQMEQPADNTRSEEMARAFEKYLDRKPVSQEDFVKGFTFGCGFSAGLDVMKADIAELVRLLDGALTCAPSLLKMPIGTEIQAAIVKYRDVAKV
jgi:hypothetical protein